MFGFKRTLPDGEVRYSGEEQAVKRRALSSGSSYSRSPVSVYQDPSNATPETSSGNDIVSDDLDLRDPLGQSSSTSTPLSVANVLHCESFSINSSEPKDIFTRPEFCFGMIVEASVAPLGPSAALHKELSTSLGPQVALNFRFRADGITILLPTRKECGVLDSRTARILTILIAENSSLEFEAFVDLDLMQGSWRGTKPVPILPLCINVYGSRSSMDKVASVLSENGVFLQEPIHVNPTSTYRNPHFLSWEDDLKTPQLRQCLPPQHDIDAGVQEILDPSNSVKDSDLPRQDSRILRVLHNHQLAALQFMIAREEEHACDETLSLWQRQWRLGRPVFVHKVTKAEKSTKPPEAQGGILADEMGTGKSLTVLAVVVHTLNEARLQAYRSSAIQAQSRESLSSGSTLIIAPKSVLYNWQSEVEKHMPGILKLSLYHGTRSSADLKLLEESDIVLTTYETACLDHFRGGVLQSIHWFRIVLDEAHQIRNRSTKTFQAVMGLQAQRRWCLTGTPVQNKLEDLFSLTEFIRFYPVDNCSNTRRYILNPLGRNDKHVLMDLRSIMTTVALRRSKAACQSSRRSEIEELIVLSSNERERYDQILSHARTLCSEFARDSSSHVLRSIIKLRQICSRGTLNPTLETRRDPRILEQRPSCRHCGDSLQPSPMQIEADQYVQGPQLCYDCALTWGDATPETSPNHSSLDASFRETAVLSTDEKWMSIDEEVSVCGDIDIDMVRDESPVMNAENSSKLEKVLSKLIYLQGVFNNDNTPVKSLVFSSWTTTLTCLGLALEECKIPFLRIDGSQSLDERAMNVNRFQSDADPRVMLLSTGCGAVGLNLTAASYVHILEPLWNPMVEAQAAARVDRLDQTKDVVIIRYIVKHSIEERIQARQKKKILYAKFSTSQMSMDEMRDILDDPKGLEDQSQKRDGFS